MSSGLAGGEIVAPVPLSKTVGMNSAWTANRLGYFSPAYTRDTTGTGVSGHGIVGSIGYTSSSTTTLQPSTFPGTRDPSLRVLHEGRAATKARPQPNGNGTTSGWPKTTSSGSTADAILSTKRANAGRLTKADLEMMETHQKQQQAAYEEWRKQKDAEHAKRVEREKRLKKQDMQRYVQRELRVRNEEEDRFKEWNLRKGLQSEVQAMERALVMKMTSGIGRRSQVPPSVSMKRREAAFQLRTAPVTLPTRKGFDATLPELVSRQQMSAAVKDGCDALAVMIAQERGNRYDRHEGYEMRGGGDDGGDYMSYSEEGTSQPWQRTPPTQGGLLPPIAASPPGSSGRMGGSRSGSMGRDSSASRGPLAKPASQHSQEAYDDAGVADGFDSAEYGIEEAAEEEYEDEGGQVAYEFVEKEVGDDSRNRMGSRGSLQAISEDRMGEEEQ